MFASKVAASQTKKAAAPARQPQRPAARSLGHGATQGVLEESGHPLDAATAGRFQSSFGHDFSSVRVHTSERAATSAAALSARAYTVGRHVVFGRGEYAPSTSDGRHLLGHELAHVVQQSRGGTAPPRANRGLETAADQAAHQASHGGPVFVAGSSAVGIACKTLFEEFTGGAYSWPMLKLALEHTRPVDDILADIHALGPADQQKATDDIIEARTERGRKQTDLGRKQNAQTSQANKDIFDPILKENGRVLQRMDFVLDGLFLKIATSETKASLKTGTTQPAAAQKPAIDAALKPDQKVNAAGVQESFKECPAGPCNPGDQGSYLAELRDLMPTLIQDYWQRHVPNRGKTEHDDPTKTHPLSEMERIGNASKRETDAVFGQFKKGPPLKADTKSRRGNIHDLWKDTQKDLKSMTSGQKKQMAQRLVFYFLQSNRKIATLNAAHNADPKFDKADKALNDEAKDQSKVVGESTATSAQVQKLNEIDRGWDASAGGGHVNVQIFKKPDETSGPLAGPDVADRDFLWDMFQTLVHEYLHTLVHAKYDKYAETFGQSSNQFNTLVEGVDSLLDEVVWANVAPRVNDPALRTDVEGATYAAQPPITVRPASRRRYASYSQALKLVNIVGIRNLYAAYFLGDVDKIKPKKP